MKSALLVAAAVLIPSAVLFSQQNSTAPQPRANALPAVGPAQPKFGRPVPRPDGILPKVPDGFTVSVYAELRAPRMMVYAPNGDLFVSSPAANNITVLRDANNDGVFESRGVYAQGEVAPPRGGGAGAGAGAARGGPPPAPPTPTPAAAPNPEVNGPILGAAAPACAPPPQFANRGAGTLAAPFGMAFHDGYLYVGNTGSIVRYKYTNGDLKAQGEPEKLSLIHISEPTRLL